MAAGTQASTATAEPKGSHAVQGETDSQASGRSAPVQQARDRAVGTDLASCSTCCPESCVGLKITPLQLLSVLAAADPVRVLLSHTRATAPRLSSTCFRWQPEHLVVQPPGTQQQCQGMTVWEQCLVCLKDEDTSTSCLCLDIPAGDCLCCYTAVLYVDNC